MPPDVWDVCITMTKSYQMSEVLFILSWLKNEIQFLILQDVVGISCLDKGN